MYLRDTAKINGQHAKVLEEKSSKAVVALITAHLNDELPDDVPEDAEMGQCVPPQSICARLGQRGLSKRVN